MKFFSRCNLPPRSTVSLGSPIQHVFEERIDDNGVKVLVESAITSVDERVQAHFTESLVYSALARAGAGDTSALQRAKVFYGDVTKVPTNLAEAHQLLINMDKNFESLPVEIKRCYDNSSSKFVKALADGSVAPVLKDYIMKHDKRFATPPVTPPATPPVTPPATNE